MLFGTIDPILPIGENIVGMRVSHNEFLTALISFSNFSEYHFFVGDKHTYNSCKTALNQLAKITPNISKVKLLFRSDIPRYLKSRNYTVFHKHDPKIEPLCYMRETYANYMFPITGIVHSLSYQRFQYDFFNQMLADTYEFDNILCTSSASEKVIKNLFNSLSEKAGNKFKDFPIFRGSFKRLAFGVNEKEFSPEDHDTKIKLKETLNIPKDAILLLTVSRFSQYSKMDIFPILKKLKNLFQSNSKVYYILSGSGNESDYTEKIKDLSNSLGISDKVIIKENVSEVEKRALYKAADIFLSPSDNHQESFGITIIEAMSCGLPVIASNWNGYKDLVIDNETGFLIDTIWGDCTSAISDMAPLSYDREYHLELAQSVAVDTNDLLIKVKKLIENKSLRLKFADNTRNRVLKNFTWKNIIKQYEDTVISSKKRCSKTSKTMKKEKEYMFLTDYFKIFSHYPSKTINDTDTLSLSENGLDIINKKVKISFYEEMERVLDINLILLILQNVLSGDILVSKLKLNLRNKFKDEKIIYSILWMIKHDYIMICSVT